MKVDRLVSIIMTLLNKERIGAQELADMFEVSPRTIYRDIDAINMAGIPIRSISGVGGGFEIMPEYKIDKNVLAKIKSFIPADRAKDIEIKKNQINIDLSSWSGNRNIQPYLQMIKTAIEDYKQISFGYIAHHGNKTVRTVEPYQLVLKSSHWYFYGYCYHRSAYRLFRLSRMSELQIEQKTFVPRDYQKPILDFETIIETMQEEIKIRIHKSVLDRVLEFCTCEHFLPDGDEHYIVDFPFLENEYYYDILLSFGDKCECLEPLHIREKMKQKIQTIAAIYKDIHL